MGGTTVEKRKKKVRDLRRPSGGLKNPIRVRFREYIVPKQASSDVTSTFTFTIAANGQDNIRKIAPPPADQPWDFKVSIDSLAPQGVPDVVLEKLLETPPVRWVYVFENKGSAASLTFELSPDFEDGASQVDWSAKGTQGGHKRWKSWKESTRPASLSPTQDKVLLEKGKKYFAFLNHDQLSYKRIEELEGDLTLLRARAAAFETKDGDSARLLSIDGKDILEVYLVDPIRFSYYLQVLFEASLERLFQRVAEKATLGKVAQKAWDLATFFDQEGKKDVWDWIDKDQLNREFASEEQVSTQLKNNIEASCSRRNTWFKTSLFQEMRKDYDFDHDKKFKLYFHVGNWIQHSHKSAQGQKYMDFALHNDPWFSHWLQQPFAVGRRGAQVTSELVKKYLPKAHKMITETCLEKIRQLGLEQARTEVVALLKDHGVIEAALVKDTLSGTIRKVTMDEIRAVGGNQLVDYFKATHIRTEDVARQAQKRLALPPDALDNLIMVLHVINLAFAAKTLYEAYKKSQGKDKAAEARALVGFANASSTLVKEFYKRKSLAAALAADPRARQFMRISHGAAIIASVLDYIGGMIDIFRGHSKGRGYLVLYGTLTALYGVAGVSAVWAGITEGTILWLGAFTWTILGLVLALIAAAIVWLFYESDFETWMRNTPWGKDKAVDWLAGGRKRPTLDKLYYDYYLIVTRFFIEHLSVRGMGAKSSVQQLCVGGFEGYLCFGYLPPTAKITITFEMKMKETLQSDSLSHSETASVEIMPYLDVYRVLTGKPMLYKPYLLDELTDSSGKKTQALLVNLVSQQAYNKHTALDAEIKRLFSSSTQQLDELHKTSWTSYSVQIDLFGNGSLVIPPKPLTLTHGVGSATGTYKSKTYELDL